MVHGCVKGQTIHSLVIFPQKTIGLLANAFEPALRFQWAGRYLREKLLLAKFG
jgi:hypothetical protein